MMLHPFCLVIDQVGYLLGRGTEHCPETHILLAINVGEHSTETTMWWRGALLQSSRVNVNAGRG